MHWVLHLPLLPVHQRLAGELNLEEMRHMLMTCRHFNPAITICFATWQGFPWKKVPYYIFSQIFGAFIAGLVLMGQYHQQM